MSKYGRGGLCTTRTQHKGLKHKLDGLCVWRTARELRVRAPQDGVCATRHPHTHTDTHTRQHANRKLLPLPRRRRHRFAALSLARRSAPPPLPRSPKLPLDEIWLGLTHRCCHCCAAAPALTPLVALATIASYSLAPPAPLKALSTIAPAALTWLALARSAACSRRLGGAARPRR